MKTTKSQKILIVLITASIGSIFFFRNYAPQDARPTENLTAPKKQMRPMMAYNEPSPAPPEIKQVEKKIPVNKGWVADDGGYDTIVGMFGTKAQLLGLVNNERDRPLRHNLKLDTAAQEKADDEVLHQYFAHVAPDGKDFTYWIDKQKYAFSYAGENLSKGYESVPAAHMALMASPTHRANILSTDYNEIGIGIALGKDGYYYIVELFAASAL